jgi:hypothetical protein
VLATGAYRRDEAGICFLLHENVVNVSDKRIIAEIFVFRFIKQAILCTTVIMQ